MSAPESYRVDVGEILEEFGTPIVLDAALDLPLLVVGSEEFAPTAPAHLDITVTNTGAGIVASGTVALSVRATCSRCLAEFVLPVSAEVDGFFVEPGAEDSLPEEQEFGFIEEGTIDLMEPILTALALELPFAPLHDPECAGICPACGGDRNITQCDCAPMAAPSPFEALKGLLDGQEPR